MYRYDFSLRPLVALAEFQTLYCVMKLKETMIYRSSDCKVITSR